jgi:hypothetical protein
MNFMQRNNSDRTNLFRDRLNAAGLDDEKLIHFLVSLKNDADLTASEIQQLAEILKHNSHPGILSNLLNRDMVFINKLLEEKLQVECLQTGNKLDLISLFVRFRRIMFSLLGLVCIYMLVNALASGKSSVLFFSENPGYSVFAVSLLMCVLFILEGTQISIASLRLKDIDLASNVKSSVRKLHSKYKIEGNAQDYLAGRQLLTIITVFFISRICSFPDVEVIPGTSTTIPEVLQPWFPVLFFDFGILAALVALWLAQLTPQFWANKQPLRFLSLPIANLTVRLSHAFESIGITDLGYFLTASIVPEKPIPTSAREQYESSVTSNGYAATGVTMNWKLTKDRAMATIHEEFRFNRAGITVLNLSEEVQGEIEVEKSTFRLVREGQVSSCEFEESKGQTDGGKSFFQYAVRPHKTSFQIDDVVVKTTAFTTPLNPSERGRFYISRPARYLMISLDIPNEISIGEPQLFTLDENHANAAHDLAEYFALDEVAKTEKTVTYGCFRPFPNSGVHYELLWNKTD